MQIHSHDVISVGQIEQCGLHCYVWMKTHTTVSQSHVLIALFYPAKSFQLLSIISAKQRLLVLFLNISLLTPSDNVV